MRARKEVKSEGFAAYGIEKVVGNFNSNSNLCPHEKI